LAPHTRLALQIVAAPGVHRHFDVGEQRGYVISADRFLPLLP
jgi:hypothetical protein